MREEPKMKIELVGEIDTRKIPEHVRLNLGEAIYKSLLEDSKRPGFREGFERWKAERAKGATATP